MDETAITQYILETFKDVEVVHASGTSFFFYDPQKKFPFTTVVTNDAHDTASDLSRPSVFRLNIGVSSETYRAMFGRQPAFPHDGGTVDTGHDFTVLDQIMPHPIYTSMSWLCVLNPSVKTLEQVQRLLAEAYVLDVEKHTRK